MPFAVEKDGVRSMSSIRVWTFEEFVTTEMADDPHLVDPLIPASGITLMHGPAGAGKSALGFHLVDVLHRGKEFLGLPSVRANALYLNLEMPMQGLHFRLKNAGFKPKSYLINHPPIDLLQQGFMLTPLYRELRKIVLDELNIQCIVIDNLGTLSTQSTGNDEVARRCIAILREWFDDRAVVVIHHNRKMKFNAMTGEWIVSDEDAAGSKYWINSAVSVIHVKRENAEVRVVKHTKSQVMRMLDEEVKFTLGDNGITVTLWRKEKALELAEIELRQQQGDKWDQLPEKEKVKLLAEKLQKSPATIYRWRQGKE